MLVLYAVLAALACMKGVVIALFEKSRHLNPPFFIGGVKEEFETSEYLDDPLDKRRLCRRLLVKCLIDIVSLIVCKNVK